VAASALNETSFVSAEPHHGLTIRAIAFACGK
jgi:hypothetical protein